MKYPDNLSLSTDLYQITMGYAYWKHNKHEQPSVFNLYFRKCPFGGAYAIVAGIETALQFIENFRFESQDLAYLASLKGNDGNPLFAPEYLNYLSNLRFTGTVYGIEEGDLAFPNMPLLQVRAPLIQAQILETPLLAIMNFQTLIATKARRVVHVAQGDKVLEFGLRRAQGLDGALSASRAAFIGGVDATSNLLAGKLFNIPVKGTHAHAWVMAFPSEIEAFDAYANTLPNNCTFLVDTYDSIQGVQNAVAIGKKLRDKGFELAGIRLDSGDMTALSIQARKILDDAGFPNASIVASNDLDEYSILQMKKDGAKIDVWAVGTNLVTAKDQPALGGVYKLSAIFENNEWKYRIKKSEQIIKISTPGILETFRFIDPNGLALADGIFDSLQKNNTPSNQLINDLCDTFTIKDNFTKIPLMKNLIQDGIRIYPNKSLSEIKDFSLNRLKMFPTELFDLKNPKTYFVGLDTHLFHLKSQMAKKD